MPEVALFVEDNAHQKVVGALLRRLADESGLTVRLDIRQAIEFHIESQRKYGDPVPKPGAGVAKADNSSHTDSEWS